MDFLCKCFSCCSVRVIALLFATSTFGGIFANEKLLQDSVLRKKQGQGPCLAALKVAAADERLTQPIEVVNRLTESLRQKGLFLERITRSLTRIYSHQSMGTFMRNNRKELERADSSALAILLHFRQTNGVFPDSAELLLKLSQYIRIRILKGVQLGEGIRFLPQMKTSSRDFSVAELSLTLVEIYLTQIQLHGLTLDLSRNPLSVDLIGFAMGRGRDKMGLVQENLDENFLNKRIEAAQRRAYQVVTDQAPSELLGKTSRTFRERIMFAFLWASELRRFVDLQSQLEDIVVNSVLSLYLADDMEFRQVLSNLLSWYQRDSADQDSVNAILAYYDLSRSFGTISPDNEAIFLKLQEDGKLPKRIPAIKPFQQEPPFEMMDLGIGNHNIGSVNFDDSLQF